MSFEEKVYAIVKVLAREAQVCKQRRLIAICGDKQSKTKFVAKIIKNIYKNYEEKEILYATDTLEKDTHGYERFVKFAREFDIKFTKITFKEANKIMGRTFDVVVMDLSYDLNPNDIGRIVETVGGGGLIFIIAPSLKKWAEMWTGFHKNLVTPPYTIDDVKRRFNKRFINKLKEHEGILIVDYDKQEFIKLPKKIVAKPKESGEIAIPNNIKIPKTIYRLAATQDQVKAIKFLEKLLEEGRIALVITANRGRGKSATLGLALVGVAHMLAKQRSTVKVAVTAPELENAQTLLKFAEIALKRLKYKIKRTRDRDLVILDAKKIKFVYVRVSKILQEKAEILAVDEAAGIHVPILNQLIKNFDKIVFSTTIHGYEGAGRGFNVKFLQNAKKKALIKIEEINMEEPIRYAENDPIEKWLYDTLLLDAEPAKLDAKDLGQIENNELVYEEVDLNKWFSKDEDSLRQFIGIYVLAHYRNRPSDVALLADAPNHEARVIKTKGGKIVNALQIAREGGLPKEDIERMLNGYKPRGNVIPDLILKYYNSIDFARSKGYRVVRIATHPDVMNKGIGSFALKCLEEDAKKRKFKWIGSGFGASYDLLKFWIENEFIPVHISPSRNEISGEYSVVVIKPLDDRIAEIVEQANLCMKLRLLSSMQDTYADLEPEVVRLLLDSGKPLNYEVKLDENQKHRLKMYLNGIFSYEITCDAIRELLKYAFLTKYPINKKTKELLIYRVFQCKNWIKTARKFDMSVEKVINKIKDTIKRISKDLELF